jgi:periplasmic divalent cation tolerance protein
MTPSSTELAGAAGPMRMVLSAYPSRTAAVSALEGALERRLVACGSILPATSRYWWKGQLESADEALVLYKTVPARVGALFRYLKESHPYEVPEIVELDVTRVERGYLAYLGRTLGDRPGRLHRGAPATRREERRAPGARAPGRRRGKPRRPSR